MAKGGFLGEFEQMVLLAVMRLNDSAYGARIRQLIADRTGRAVTIGSLYAALDRLEKKKLLRSTESPPEPVRGGRAKRVYSLTSIGLRTLSHSQTMMRRMAEGLALDSEVGNL